MNKTYNVFVYGTLRKHEVNHGLLKEANCLARQCWTYGTLYDTGCGYPAVVRSKENRVYGELYEVTAEQLQHLDWLEGYTGDEASNDYDRVIQNIYTDNGTVQAYIYVYSPHKAAGLTEIRFGDWKCHRHLSKEQLLYFAYGSCMDDDRFKKAGVADLFTNIKGCGIVKGYSLGYTRKFADGGRADLVESEQHWAEGKVYEINQQALSYLHKREGVNAAIYRPAFIEIEINGVLYKDVLTYLVVEKEKETAPPEHYANEILRGAKNFVSDEYYRKLSEDLYEKFNMTLPVIH